MKIPKIGLDVDELIFAFTNHFFKYLGLDETPPTDWHDPRIDDNFHLIKDDLKFWHSIPPLISPKEILMPVHCYCTARPISSENTMACLDRYKFPKAEVRTVGYQGSKVEMLRDVDFFIDDAIHNFEALNNAGINCYLYTQPHNLHCKTDKRVDSLEEFYKIIENSMKSL